MTNDTRFDLELLRPLEYVCEPDPRQRHFVDMNPVTSASRPITLNDCHEDVSQIGLNASVPRDIVVQFETAKNLYLYAWFIYRFYPVAEHQVFACLELALRMRYGKEIQSKKSKDKNLKSKQPMLRALLRYAIDKGDIKNEGFRKWHESVELRARERYEREKADEMEAKKLDQIELNYSKIVITDVDRNLDYVNILLETLPELRNHYAHGTLMLHNAVLKTIELVSEIINQIYPSATL
jgi:hypothetical protein